MMMAQLILAVHIAIIGFNLFGLILIPVGARCGWSFVRAPFWRTLHVLSWAVVALQAIAGRACFLTVWQDELAGAQDGGTPLIMRWMDGIIYWPLPLWVFALLYIAAFIYVLALLWLVPPRWETRSGIASPR